MSHLVPCPGCARHVRQSEAQCPFCDAALALDHLPPPVLPRGRMGRAATFAFGASLVGATSLVACGSGFEEGEGGGGSSGAPMPVYGAPAAGMAGQQSGGSATGGSATGGSATGGSTTGGTGGVPVAPAYGAPAAGMGPGGGANEGGSGGSAGNGGSGGNAGNGGSGGNAANGGSAGTGIGPVYGAPP